MNPIVKLWALVRSWLLLIFGDIHLDWNPPGWWKASAARVATSPVGRASGRAKARADDWIRRDPKRAARWSLAAVAVLLAIGIGTEALLRYLASRPKPAYVTVDIVAPQPTHPEKKIVDKVTINFSNSAAKLKDLNRELTEGVRLTPSVAGSWRWESDRKLTFTPKSGGTKPFDWPAGEQYKVSFDRDLSPDHLKFETLSYLFVTHPIELKFSKWDFYIDPQNPKIKRVVATLTSNYPLDTEDFKKRVSFLFQSKDDSVLKKPASSVPFSVSFNPYFTAAYLQSETFPLPKDDHVMSITVAKGARSSLGGQGSDEERQVSVDVTGLYNAFKVTQAQVIFARNEKFEPEQVLVMDTAIDVKSEDIQKSLEAYLLPADHQPPGSKKVVQGYNWGSPGEFTEAIKAQSTPVALKLIPSEETYSQHHSFRVELPVNRYVFLRLRKGVKGIGEYELGQDHEQIVSVPDFTPELMFMSQGALLSLGGDKKLPLLARNLEQVSYEISRILPSQLNHLVTNLSYGGSFAKPYSFSSVEDSISEKFKVDQKLPFKTRSDTMYFSLDLEPYIRDGRGLFYVRVRSKEPGNSPRSRPQKEDSRLILVTDLGIVAKQNVSGTTDVFVQNVRTGMPVDGAQVDVLGQNGISALTVATDAAGRAQIPGLKDYRNEKKPIAFLVRKGADVSFLPYQYSDRELHFSRFDVDGVYESSESDQLTAMLFSDRGIYRPGEKVNLGVILRSKNWKPGLPQIPLQWTVTDPRGNVIKRERFKGNPFGLLELGFGTQDTSPVGNYEAQVSIIKYRGTYEYTEQLGSASVRVEEFVPDQMRITATLDPFRAAGWVPLGKLKANVSLKNLFGTPAENRRVISEISLVPAVPYVPAYRDYVFANPNKKDARVMTESLEERHTDEKGNVSYDIDLTKYDGYFQLRFQTEGFQAEGGRGVNANAGVAVSSQPFLVGYKADGDLHYINRGAERSVKWLAIDPQHQLTAAADLKIALVERRYVSSLMRQDDGTYRYQSVRKDFELEEKPLVLPKAGALSKLPTDKPGEFAYVVRNETGRELNRVEFNVVGDTNLSRSLDRTAELQLALNKTDYQPGEDVEVQIKSPYAGAGLITIERDAVYAHKWFKAAGTSQVERIKIPAGLEGNAYINVTFLRAINSREIFMSPLSYGVQPFSISLDRHRTKISLKTPEKVKPGQALKIQYSTDRPTELVLYGVDEGILQVAQYKLPDPIKFFFRKRALQVRTFQLLDLLLPEYSVIQEMSSPGGDSGYDALGKNLNPFKRKDQPPVVFWSGVMKADSNPRTFTFQVPEYFNGNLKVMAVASSDQGLGSVEQATISRGDFVISPTTPLFVAPGDEFVVGVNVSNQLEEASAPSKLTVQISPSDHLEAVGSPSQTIDVAPGHEKGLDFRLKARPKPGSADLKFVVSAGKRSSRLSTALSVRPAVPYITTLKAGVADHLPLTLDIERKRIPEFQKNALDASVIPISLGGGLISFLDSYAYGCTEQLISKAVPSLFFRGRPEFSYEPAKAREFHDQTVAMLRTRQSTNGGFALYSGTEHASIPASLYAIRYLTESDDRGYPTPDDLKNRSLSYLKLSELRRADTLSTARLFAEAIYLQARNHLVPTNDLTFLKEALEKNHKGHWEKDAIAAYLAGTYALLKQEEKGLALLRDMKLGEYSIQDYDNYQDSLVRDAILLEIAGRHYPAELKRLTAGDAMKAMIDPLKRGQYNTYSSAHTLMALDAILSTADKAGVPGDLGIAEITGGKETPLTFARGLIARVTPSNAATAVKITGNNELPLFYSLTESGFDRELPKEEKKSGLEVSRVYLSKDGTPVTKVKLGDEVTVSVRARSLNNEPFDNLVLVDLYPAGFELIAESHVGNSKSPGTESDSEAEPATERGADTDSDSGDGGDASIFRFLEHSAYAESAPDLSPMSTSFVDYREDRVVIYGYASRDVKEFRYRLKAVNRGKFVVPPAFGESMYDRAIQYRGVAQSIEIE